MTHQPKTILLVEDNPNDAELTISALGQRGHSQIVLVEDGITALDYLFYQGHFQSRIKGNPVVMFLDLKMPKVDGLEVLRRVKQNQELKTIPVVMLTSSRENKDLIRSYESGVNAYVVKPVDYKEFVQSIRQIGIFWTAINEPPPD
jgi:CheY-like chemotaxis protein